MSTCRAALIPNPNILDKTSTSLSMFRGVTNQAEPCPNCREGSNPSRSDPASSSRSRHRVPASTTVGNPLGELTFSESTGIISALDRSITMSDGRQMNMIQTDCAINSGNSGGPLFNSHGEVIGIVSAKYSSGSNSSSASVEGLGFAIPMDDVASMVSDLVKNGYVTGKPIMGIIVTDVDQNVTSYGVPQGAIIRVVTPDLCGAKAGLQAGDIVTKIDNTDVTSASDLTSAIGNDKPGDKVTLTIFRSGETKTVEVTLEESTPEKTEKQNQAQQEYQQEYQQSQQQQQQSQQQQQGSSGWPFGSFGY